MRTILMLRTLVLTLILTGIGTTAQAVDMTGTWTGEETCRCFNDVVGKFTEQYSDQVMKIAQDGTDLNIEAYGELFNGNVINDPRRDHKGEASLIACTTDPADNASFGELGRAKVSAKANGRGKMVIKSLWNPQENEICQCRAGFRRVDTTDPEIGDCSEARVNRIDAWHDAMLDTPPKGSGCYEATHPSMKWHKVRCHEAQTGRSPSGGAVIGAQPLGQSVRSVGKGTDFLVRIAGGHFTTVTGSFENAIGVTSIASDFSTHQTPDRWTLQLNTNKFVTPKCQGVTIPSFIEELGIHCLGWQQFIYLSPGGADHHHGSMFIQHWLLNFRVGSANFECPSGWNAHKNSCWKDSAHKSVPAVAVSELGHVHLSGVSGPTHDHVIMRIDDTLHAHAVPADSHPLDELLSLNQKWTDAEFNIFGGGGGSDATFNANSTVDVTVTVDGHIGGHITCPAGGTTDETNSLTLRGECAQVAHSNPPKYQFTQDNLPGRRPR